MRIPVMIFCAIMGSSALAQNQAAMLLMPSPWTIGITLAQWLSKDSKKILYVEVTAEGADLEQARQSAFRMAVERAIGTVVASETESTNGRLGRDEIITYASGYVDDYQLVETNQVNGRTQVKMKVWVSHNKLANRLLNQSQTAGTIEGGKIAEQIRSVHHERTQGDRLIGTVLKDFPARSFDVVLRQTRVTMDPDRRPILHVEFDLAWNRHYIDSLAVAIKSINQRNDCGNWFGDCRATTIIGGGGAVAGMDDSSAWHLMHGAMVISRPTILLRVLDTDNQVRFRQCVSVKELDHSDYAVWRYVDVEPGRIRVNHDRRKRITVPLDLSNIDAKNLDKVDIKVVRNSSC